MKKFEEKGVSLIESLVCVVIIGIGYIAMLQLSAFSIGSMDRAIEKNKINFYSEMMMEDIISDPEEVKNYATFNERCSYNISNGSNYHQKQTDKWKKIIKLKDQIRINNKYKSPKCNQSTDIKQILSDADGNKARLKFITEKGKSKKYLGLLVK